MKSQHVHQWFRLPSISSKNKDMFYCRHPTCYKKIRLEVLNNKMAECSTCSQKFIVDIENLPTNTNRLVCPKCSGLPASNAQAQLLETIQQEAHLFLNTNYVTVLEELKFREKNMADKEILLERKLMKMERQREILKENIQIFRRRMYRERLSLRERMEKFQKKVKEDKEKQELVLSATTEETIDKQVLADAILNILQRKMTPDEPNGPS